MSKQVIFSRNEKRLQSEAIRSNNTQEKRLKRAELAAYQSRIGRFDLARIEIDNLRKENSEIPCLKVSIAIHIAEGLYNYFSDVGVTSADSMERAYALSVAGGELQFQALSASWLAQWEYSRFNFPALWRYVTESLRLADPKNSSALSRAYLVGAQALHLADRADLARNWYKKSHEIASRVQDDATVSAIMHNTSWLQMLCLRQEVLAGISDKSGGRQALLNAQSTANFDLLHGDTSWNQLKPLLQAQISSLIDKPDDALKIYIDNFSEIHSAGRLRSYLSADVAWCFLRQNINKEALLWADISEMSLPEVSQSDDRAATHSVLSIVYNNISMFEKSKIHSESAKKLWNEHIGIQASIVDLWGVHNSI